MEAAPKRRSARWSRCIASAARATRSRGPTTRLRAERVGVDPRRARGRAVAAQIKCGTVNINEAYGATYGSLDAPMGGMRDSGLGRRQGAEGMLRFTDSQAVGTQRLLPIAPTHGHVERAVRRDHDHPLRLLKKLRLRDLRLRRRGRRLGVRRLRVGVATDREGVSRRRPRSRRRIRRVGVSARRRGMLKHFLFAPGLGCYGIQRIDVLKDCLILRGAGVGGGSLVYANTLVRAAGSVLSRSGVACTSPIGGRSWPLL